MNRNEEITNDIMQIIEQFHKIMKLQLPLLESEVNTFPIDQSATHRVADLSWTNIRLRKNRNPIG